LFLVLGICVTLAVGGTKARAQETADEPSTEGVSIESIQEVRSLRCESLDKAKRASRKADVYASSAASMPYGASKITAEEKASQARAEADSGYTESGRLKKQVASMVERFVTEQQALLDATTDEAERAKIEAAMALAQELRDEGCS